MNKYDTILLKIANTLLVNAQHLPVIGLFDGQLGVALFFYQYGRYSGRPFYTDYSDRVMDAVIESIRAGMPRDFGSGLAGIRWAIDHLAKNGFVEADENLFGEIDAALGTVSVEKLVAEFGTDTPPLADPEAMIRACWRETVFGNSFSAAIETDAIEDFVDRALRDIEERNLTFYGGLAGLGLSLIQSSGKL